VPTLTVLYDEDCGFCDEAARWLARRGIGIEIAAIGSAQGAALLRDLALGERYAGVHAVDRLGRRRTGAGAVSAIARLVPGCQVLAAIASQFPGATSLVYGAIARRRGAISSLLGVTACGVRGRPRSAGRELPAYVAAPDVSRSSKYSIVRRNP
jgi:predicted DCC family thiol-disulfide oxidoreductase YuxK